MNDLKFLSISKGMFSIVDEDDFEKVNQCKWKAVKSHASIHSKPYVKRTPTKSHACQILSRFILNAPKGTCVDHINGNTLDNRKINLRLCNRQQNQHAQRNRPLRYTSKYRGVMKSKDCSSWLAQITFDWKRIHIGSYKTEIEAAIARDRKAIEIHGEFAQLNFPI